MEAAGRGESKRRSVRARGRGSRRAPRRPDPASAQAARPPRTPPATAGAAGAARADRGARPSRRRPARGRAPPPPMPSPSSRRQPTIAACRRRRWRRRPAVSVHAQVRRATTVDASQRPPARRVLASMPWASRVGQAQASTASPRSLTAASGAEPMPGVLGGAPAARGVRPAHHQRPTCRRAGRRSTRRSCAVPLSADATARPGGALAEETSTGCSKSPRDRARGRAAPSSQATSAPRPAAHRERRRLRARRRQPGGAHGPRPAPRRGACGHAHQEAAAAALAPEDAGRARPGRSPPAGPGRAAAVDGRRPRSRRRPARAAPPRPAAAEHPRHDAVAEGVRATAGAPAPRPDRPRRASTRARPRRGCATCTRPRRAAGRRAHDPGRQRAPGGRRQRRPDAGVGRPSRAETHAGPPRRRGPAPGRGGRDRSPARLRGAEPHPADAITRGRRRARRGTSASSSRGCRPGPAATARRMLAL